jgi:CheY-like chemotaxis protein
VPGTGDASHEHMTTTKTDPPRSGFVRRHRVFVADDDDDTLLFVSTVLRRDGHTVIEARSGTELLDLLASAILDHQRAPDLILTDVRMEGPSGLEILQGFRHAHWAVPIVVMSAYGRRRLADIGRRLGASAVLTKPFEVERLRETVNALVSTRPARRAAH